MAWPSNNQQELEGLVKLQDLAVRQFLRRMWVFGKVDHFCVVIGGVTEEQVQITCKS